MIDIDSNERMNRSTTAATVQKHCSAFIHRKHDRFTIGKGFYTLMSWRRIWIRIIPQAFKEEAMRYDKIENYESKSVTHAGEFSNRNSGVDYGPRDHRDEQQNPAALTIMVPCSTCTWG